MVYIISRADKLIKKIILAKEKPTVNKWNLFDKYSFEGYVYWKNINIVHDVVIILFA